MRVAISFTSRQWRFEVLVISCFILVMTSIGCSLLSLPGPTSNNTPEEMFEALIQSPIPADITNLEGAGDTWQGHSIYLRFQATSTFIEAYIAQEFEEVPCETLVGYLELPDRSYDVFDPSWEPEKVTSGRCFRSEGPVGESWIGQQYLLWDISKNVVYFYGLGI